MNCKHCGSELVEGAAFCTQCGAAVSESRSKKIWVALGKAACYFIVFNLIQIISVTVYSIVISIVCNVLILSGHIIADDPIAYINTLYYTYINELLTISGLLTILAMFIFFRARKRRLHKEIKLRPVSPSVIILAVVLGMAAQLAINFTLSIMSVFLPEWMFSALEDQNGILTNGSIITQIVNVALITPIVEEIIFRGLIHTRLRRALPKAAAVAVSSVIFGIAHGNIIGFFYAGALGVILALVFEKYESVIPPMLIHAGFNGTSYLLTLLPNNPLIIWGLYFISIAITIAILYLMLRKNAARDYTPNQPNNSLTDNT